MFICEILEQFKINFIMSVRIQETLTIRKDK